MAESKNEVLFTATMKYSTETIRKLTDMQYNTFSFNSKIFQALIGVALVVFGLYGNGSSFGIVCIAAGCFTLVSLNVSSRMQADKLCQQYKNGFPVLEYSFTSSGIRTQQIDKETPFSTIIKIIDDGKYLYMFVDKMTVYMLESASVKGNNGLNGLKKHIEKKTGLTWKKPNTLLNANLRSVREAAAASRENSTIDTGERLKDPNHRF